MESKVIQHAITYLKQNYSNTLDELGQGPKDVQPLTVDDINLLHKEMVEYLGGSSEIRDQNLLESLAIAPFGEYFDVVLYPTIFDKAAKYMLDFSQYQVYLDGNKRMGLATATSFLYSQGYALTLTEEQASNLVLDIATNKITTVEEISEIIKNNYKFISTEMEVEITKATEERIDEETTDLSDESESKEDDEITI